MTQSSVSRDLLQHNVERYGTQIHWEILGHLRVLSSFLRILFFLFVPKSTFGSSTWLDKVYLQRFPTIFCQLWNNSQKSTKGVKSTSYIHLEHLNRHFQTKRIITNWAWRICSELNWDKFWITFQKFLGRFSNFSLTCSGLWLAHLKTSHLFAIPYLVHAAFLEFSNQLLVSEDRLDQ